MFFGMFTLTVSHKAAQTHNEERGNVNSLHFEQSTYLQDTGILPRLHSQIGLQPIHNLDFIRLQLSVALMLIPCASKPD